VSSRNFKVAGQPVTAADWQAFSDLHEQEFSADSAKEHRVEIPGDTRLISERASPGLPSQEILRERLQPFQAVSLRNGDCPRIPAVAAKRSARRCIAFLTLTQIICRVHYSCRPSVVRYTGIHAESCILYAKARPRIPGGVQRKCSSQAGWLPWTDGLRSRCWRLREDSAPFD